MGRPLPLKFASEFGGSGPISNTWFQVHKLNGISIGSHLLMSSFSKSNSRVHKSSALAEMGDRARAKWAQKPGLFICTFPWGS